MRIIAEIPHPIYKISIFKNDNRYSLKVEKNLLEMTFKFRDGSGIENTDDIKRFADEAFLSEIDKSFKMMAKARSERLIELITSPENEFQNII